MNDFLRLDGVGLWHVAGWTMLHFAWLGAVVMVAAAACRLVVRRAPAHLRYASAVASLALLGALPIGVAAWLVGRPPVAAVVEPIAQVAEQMSQVQQVQQVPQTIVGASPRVATTEPVLEPSAGRDLRAASESAPAAHGSAAGSAGDAAGLAPPVPRQSRGLTGVAALESVAVYLPWVWLVGTPITFALLATGLVGTKRLRGESRIVDDGPIAEACARLCRTLRVRGRVVVAVCERIAAPVLVGIVRPMILLPPAALAGWSPDEVEMVLLHELAHVRRWDNLVNLAQRIVESLLFFHPAVWWASAWVRREREACCDAVVVGHTQRPHAYAEMLIEFASRLSAPSEPGRPRPRLTAALTSAMAAGPLRSRIRRILQLEDDPMLVSGKSLAIVMAGLVLAATFTVLYLPSLGQAQQSAAESGAVVAESTNDAKGRDAAAEAQTRKNLKRLILSLWNHENNTGSLPPNANYDAQGKPLLSWRVLVLPELGEEDLWREFHLDEPWDSEHNRQLIARMPEVFKNPRIDRVGVTNYLAIVGKECVFDGTPKGIAIKQITDGTSKTIALVEANADRAVEWTKPQDWEFDREHPTAGLGSLWRDHWYAAWADASVRRVDNSESPDVVGIQFTRDGRELRTLKESKDIDWNRVPTDDQSKSEGRGNRIVQNNRQQGERPEAEPQDSEHRVQVQNRQSKSKFPSLQEQKLADLAYGVLGLELEPMGPEDLNRVRAQGYDGGLKVIGGREANSKDGVWENDILVGLGVWPTTSLDDVARILRRDDLAELNPLKFYAVRQKQGGYGPGPDEVITGRISVRADRAERETAPTGPADEEEGPSRRAAKPQAEGNAGTSVDKSSLRYDGKTFDQWRHAWQTELSPERRTEAVKALAAFGANGYGREATEAILEIAKQYDWESVGDRSPVGKLKEQAMYALTGTNDATHIPATDSLPVLLGAVQSDNRQVRMFLTQVLGSGYLHTPQATDALIELSRDADPDVRRSAVDSLPWIYATNPNRKVVERIRDGLRGDNTDVIPFMCKLLPPWSVGSHAAPMPGVRMQLYYVPELYAKLFSQHESVRRLARAMIQYIRPADAPPLVKQLVQVLSSDAGIEKQVEAIRALAAIGSPAREALPAIERLLAKPVNFDDPRVVPAAVAREAIGQGDNAMTIVAQLGYHGDAVKIVGEEKTTVLSPHTLGGGGGGMF